MLESRATVLYMCHGRRRRRVAPIRVYRHPAEAGGEVLGHAGHGPAVRKPHPHNAPRQLLRGHPRLGHEYVDPALLLSAAEDQLHGGVVHRALEGAAHAHPHTAAFRTSWGPTPLRAWGRSTGGRLRAARSRERGRPGPDLEKSWHCTGTAMELQWKWTGTTRVESWYSPGAALLLHWYCTGKALVVHWYYTFLHLSYTAPALVLHWYCIGTILVLRCTRTVSAPV